MIKTMFDVLQEQAEQIVKDASRLICEFSNLHPINDDNSNVTFLNVHGDHSWKTLPPEGKQLQVELNKKVKKFNSLVTALFQNLPENEQEDIELHLQELARIVAQDEPTTAKTSKEAADLFQKAMQDIINTLDKCYADSSDPALAVVDTNALLTNSNIEGWRFDGIKQFTIVLAPTILRELDKKKMNRNNESVREKADSIVRRIKEYRRRGHLPDGVNIVNGKIMLQTIAEEPDMAQSLPAFDENNEDDRLLASTLEVMRSHLKREVFIVTGDLLLQSKAEMHGIPFREIPGPE